MSYALARLGPAPDRPATWRFHAKRAALAAMKAGDLDPRTYAMVNVLLDASDGHGADRKWYLRTLGQWLGGRSARAAGRWTGRAVAAGWLARHHYRRLDEPTGQWSTPANRWRVEIPPEYEEWLAAHPTPEYDAATPAGKRRNRRGDRRGWPAPLPVEAVEALAAPMVTRPVSEPTALQRRVARIAERVARGP